MAATAVSAEVKKMGQLVANDLTQQVPTTGIQIAYSNSRRVWMAFTNEGPNFIDLLWLGRDGAAVVGRVRLFSGGSAVFSMKGDMPWDGALSAVADTATTTLAGVEVEEWE